MKIRTIAACTFPILSAAAAGAANFGPGEAGPIADGPDGVTTYELDIAASGAIGDAGRFLSVNIDLAHTWAGDLAITLKHNGVEVTLLDRLGVPESEFGQSADFDGVYTFSDNGASWAPFEIADLGSGFVIPESVYQTNNSDGSNLDQFSGQDIFGVWTLTVRDAENFDTGAIRSWSLDVVPAPSAAAVFGIAGTSLVRRRSRRATDPV